MSKFFSLSFLFFSLLSFSQSEYVSGYYIDQSNNKIVGFIEDITTFNSPEKINFKSSINGEVTTITLDNIKEFKIDSYYKYVNYNVDYDYDQVFNRNEINMSGKDPLIKTKNVLLKVLVEGDVSLYKAVISDKIFFYIKKGNNESPKLLIHRKYNANNSILENNEFRKQLYEAMKSESFTMDNFLNLDYDEAELKSLLIKYNTLNKSLVNSNVNLDRYKNKFYYKVFGGSSILNASYSILSTFKLSQSESSIFNPIVGVELSNVLGVNKKRSEIFGRIFYQKLEAKTSYFNNTNPNFTEAVNLDFNLSTVNISAGYRYAFYKDKQNKFFVDASIGMLKVLNSDIKYQEIVDFIPSSPNQDVMNSASFTDTNTRLFVNFGIGYEFNKKYSINLQYTPSQDYLNRSAFTGGISSFSVFFAYTLNK